MKRKYLLAICYDLYYQNINVEASNLIFIFEHIKIWNSMLGRNKSDLVAYVRPNQHLWNIPAVIVVVS